MPDFIYEHKVYYNPVEFALLFIGGTWKMPILWRLREQKKRYGELKTSLDGITHKMLSTQLKELEKDQLLKRIVYEVIPPKVEYELTALGKTAIPIIETLRNWGITMMKHDGVKQGLPKA